MTVQETLTQRSPPRRPSEVPHDTHPPFSGTFSAEAVEQHVYGSPGAAMSLVGAGGGGLGSIASQARSTPPSMALMTGGSLRRLNSSPSGIGAGAAEAVRPLQPVLDLGHISQLSAPVPAPAAAQARGGAPGVPFVPGFSGAGARVVRVPEVLWPFFAGDVLPRLRIDMGEMRARLDAGDLDTVKKIAHRLKGSALTFGMADVDMQCRRIMVKETTYALAAGWLAELEQWLAVSVFEPHDIDIGGG
jgi:hypothetical protein